MRTVNIKGKEYIPVAERLNEFRKKHSIDDGWGVLTHVAYQDSERVITATEIVNPEGAVIARDVAQEEYTAKGINKTSALENCATSSVGRALAAAGLLGGAEYCSADELAVALQGQVEEEEYDDLGAGATASGPPIPGHWPKAAQFDYAVLFDEGTSRYGAEEFEKRLNRLVMYGYDVNSLEDLDFKKDGKKLYEEIRQMFKSNEELEEENG